MALWLVAQELSMTAYECIRFIMGNKCSRLCKFLRSEVRGCSKSVEVKLTAKTGNL